MSAPTRTYRLSVHPRRPDHPALLNTDGSVAHTFAYNAERADVLASLEHAGLMLHPDNTVTPDGDPPKEDGEIAASAAAALLPATTTMAANLGRHLADTERAYSAFDQVALKAGTLRNAPDGDDARAILDDRVEALRILISTTPAKSVQDAAVLISEALTIAGRLASSLFSKDEADALANRMERMLLAAMPFVAEAAGLDMVEMNWADRDVLRMARYAGMGVQS